MRVPDLGEFRRNPDERALEPLKQIRVGEFIEKSVLIDSPLKIRLFQQPDGREVVITQAGGFNRLEENRRVQRRILLCVHDVKTQELAFQVLPAKATLVVAEMDNEKIADAPNPRVRLLQTAGVLPLTDQMTPLVIIQHCVEMFPDDVFATTSGRLHPPLRQLPVQSPVDMRLNLIASGCD
ncbi:MAG TPA: hypothetical protein P5081_20780 [Phycisphaerae bacterium]|nr:hypothetical protein [Phycisphaerae bacterium]HRW55316.1 hypothetical protein [Phycisphaerae bacterium]